MFGKLPEIRSAKEILETAYKKTKKIQKSDKNALYKQKKTIIAKTARPSTSAKMI